MLSVVVVADSLEAAKFAKERHAADTTSAIANEIQFSSIICGAPTDHASLRERFLDISDRIGLIANSLAVQSPSATIVGVITAAIDEVSLSAIGTPTWSSLAGMLILAFPDVRWLLHGMTDHLPASARWSASAFLASEEPLFDGAGLRDWVRSRTNNELQKATSLTLRLRNPIAAAIDEEAAFAYMHAYSAYRFGYRAHAITTWAEMERRFNPGPGEAIEPHGYELLLEDMNLNFPDRPLDLHLRNLETERAKNCCLLESSNGKVENSERRVLVTTGQSGDDKEVFGANCRYLEKNKTTGKLITHVFKPASGIFDFWAKLELPPEKSRGGLSSLPEGTHENASSEKPTGHGTPGLLLLVVETLVQRAAQLEKSAFSIKTAMIGAVLATDALELNGGRTPTLAVEALALKHRFEVMGECQFSGVEYHLSVAPRIEEIERDTKIISSWFHADQQENAHMNSTMHVLSGVMRVFRANNQFDEEQICLNKMRKLHGALWLTHGSKWKNSRWIAWALKLPMWYVRELLGSVVHYGVVLLVWVFMVAILLLYVGGYSTESIEILGLNVRPQWLCAFQESVTTFFGMGAPVRTPEVCGKEPRDWMYGGLIAITIVSGFLHLGIGVAHLYALISRK